ncbi:hypothetical protein Airi02_101810 [Actinoallomurus iriomotensis]|uniref:Uncharacterized protein n=1 Tax=Actinoallomurus iriomotensis TaxID=478107 RepID=A0A9W6SF22_9ACTN|nr:hypothetical protein Airi02_101810 [Actinoallomurus iriomotensis]
MAEPLPVPSEVDRIEAPWVLLALRAYPPPEFVAVTVLVLELLEKDPVAAYAATGATTVPTANAAAGTTILRTRRDSLKPIMLCSWVHGDADGPGDHGEFEHRRSRLHNGGPGYSRARHETGT